MKRILISLAVVALVAPQIALASWWNPFTWKIFHKPAEVPIEEPKQIIEVEDQKATITATSTTKAEQPKREVIESKKESIDSRSSEIAKLKKEVEELKKRQSGNQLTSKQLIPTVQNSQAEKKSEEKPKITTTTLPNGAVVETDVSGNIIRTTKEAPQQSYIAPTLTTQSQTPTPTVIQISGVNIISAINSAKIEWQTDKPTESKIFLSGGGFLSKVQNSESGLSTRHAVFLDSLDTDMNYTYEIEAISNSDFSKKTGSFSTDSRKPTTIAFSDDSYYPLPSSSYGGNCQQNRFYVGIKDQFGNFMNDQMVSFYNPETQEIISRKTNSSKNFADFVYVPQTKNDILTLKFYITNSSIAPLVSIFRVNPMPDSAFDSSHITTDESGKSYSKSSGILVDPVKKICL